MQLLFKPYLYGTETIDIRAYQVLKKNENITDNQENNLMYLLVQQQNNNAVFYDIQIKITILHNKKTEKIVYNNYIRKQDVHISMRLYYIACEQYENFMRIGYHTGESETIKITKAGILYDIVNPLIESLREYKYNQDTQLLFKRVMPLAQQYRSYDSKLDTLLQSM